MSWFIVSPRKTFYRFGVIRVTMAKLIRAIHNFELDYPGRESLEFAKSYRFGGG